MVVTHKRQVKLSSFILTLFSFKNHVKLLNMKYFILPFLLLTFNSNCAVIIKDKMWKPNTVLNVVFIDGSQKQQQFVKTIATQWLLNTNLSFHFFDSFANAPKQTHIRISFKLQNGSQLGNHKDYFSKSITMSLFDLTLDQVSVNSKKRIILHEFGHSLGFEHEYRNHHWPYGMQPIQKIIFNCLPKMIKIGYVKITAKDKCETINSPVKLNDSYTTAYDEMSIMNYPLSFIQNNGIAKTIKVQSTLSYLDKYAMQFWYAL